MVLCMACWAAAVMESASSRNDQLCVARRVSSLRRSFGEHFDLVADDGDAASSDALSSMTASFARGPSNCRAKHNIVVVLPVPGGPLKIMLGMFPPFTTAWSLATVSSFPTTSFRSWGRYFSTQGCVDIVLRGARGGVGAGALARGGAGSLRRRERCYGAYSPWITNTVLASGGGRGSVRLAI